MPKFKDMYNNSVRDKNYQVVVEPIRRLNSNLLSQQLNPMPMKFAFAYEEYVTEADPENPNMTHQRRRTAAEIDELKAQNAKSVEEFTKNQEKAGSKGFFDEYFGVNEVTETPAQTRKFMGIFSFGSHTEPHDVQADRVARMKEIFECVKPQSLDENKQAIEIIKQLVEYVVDKGYIDASKKMDLYNAASEAVNHNGLIARHVKEQFNADMSEILKPGSGSQFKA